MKFDSKENKWIDITPKSGDAPAPRFGHVQLCFYNYVFVFGGQGESGHIFGDLWVFDIIREDWVMIIDAERTHELTHNGVSGRVGAAGVLFENFGAAVIIGGLTAQGSTACDIWALDLDMIVNRIENPQQFKPENVWIKKQIGSEDEHYTC